MTKLSKGVDSRKKYFMELLGESEHAKIGIYKSLVRNGLDPKQLDRRNITYRMVEKVVLEQRSNYPSNFGFD